MHSLVLVRWPSVSAGLRERLAILLSNPDHPMASDNCEANVLMDGGGIPSGFAPSVAVTPTPPPPNVRSAAESS